MPFTGTLGSIVGMRLSRGRLSVQILLGLVGVVGTLGNSAVYFNVSRLLFM